ncbi:glycosyl hydrolase family 85-domain-containing protein [Lentinula edodes]|uniref:Glycosyl hydrolase family 85-domain-containing protein n=1 Tax=Lentinula lateritia TaxID=40482 RepID=A0A9W9B0E2_9AGAR|nr:glycosyl hydrolase family 85-domain-containing protein [Lentinula edodes]
MPILGDSKKFSPPKQSYFESLEELDEWAGTSSPVFDNTLQLYPRANGNEQRGRLLVCHDYKGGYTESPFSLSYTFNFWSSCETFVYFSHHRVTIPPPGWINASHRQGVKILGTLIFEGGGEQDSLRLLVGKLPKSRTGPVSQPTTPTSLPLSPHYARILADLAKKRGFDGYLLNFECPLVGGIEQTRALAAWITILQAELKYKIGDHAEAMWYDSVIINGKLAWQDRLNSLNLPFFLSSSSLFSNYTWRNNYPSLTAQYFLSLDSTLTGDAHTYPHIHRKKLHDIYMGVDVWGRGSHGNGGFGSFKAISHIAPSSLGLSVALFGQAWTWESEQDKPGWNWDSWWTYERKLWAGKADPAEEITVPVMPPLKNGESPCEVGVHDVFTPIVSYFQRTPPPDPLLLPFHTTFSPGVGRRWFVKGREVFHRPEGWTDIDKQTSLGDMVWPKPIVSWEGEIMDPEGLDLPNAKSQICMDNAWNGGSSLRLSLVAFGTESENAAFRCIWIPVQSLATSVGRMYEASAVYKLETDVAGVDIDVALSIKGSESSPTTRYPKFDIESLSSEDMDLGRGWSLLKIRFNLGNSIIGDINRLSSMGLVITIVSEETTQPLAFSLLLGQLNVYPSIPSSIPPHVTSLLWAHFSPSEPETTSFPNVPASLGVLTWEISTSFPSHALPRITSPDDPLAAWPAQPSAEAWFPKLLYANVYALEYQTDGTPSKVEDAIWIGTSGCGYEGMRNTFIVQSGIALSSTPDTATAGEGVLRIGNGKMRFYVQGVTETGNVLDWTRCVYIDM